MSTKRYAYLTEMRTQLSLAVPALLAQVAMISMGFVDMVMTGRVGPVDMAAVALAVLLRTDYSGLGICFIFIFYQFYYRKWLKFGLFAAVSLIVYLQAPQDYTSILAVLPMIFYNGKRGISCKYFFYIFYPAHLTVLALLRIFF